MTSNYDRVRKLFEIGEPDLKNLKFSTHGFASRIENSVDELRTPEDLAAFAASRANDLLLTAPRLAKLDDFDDDFDRLFAQLVEIEGATAPAGVAPGAPGVRQIIGRPG